MGSSRTNQCFRARDSALRTTRRCAAVKGRAHTSVDRRVEARDGLWGALRPLAAFCLGLVLTVCTDDAERLEPVKGCSDDDECTDEDPRYDRCAWVCEAQVTYCIVSCETAADCRGRGLPDAWVYCDIPRPGDGFCNSYNHEFGPDACVQEVREIPEPQ